jgi:hypothetical protein
MIIRHFLAATVIVSQCSTCCAFQSSARDNILSDWLTWAESLSPSEWSNFGRVELESKFRTYLVSRGEEPALVERHIKEVRTKITVGWPEWNRLSYNRAYREPNSIFSPEPNAFLQRIATATKPGKALDVGMGQGRNTIWLAQHGWDVTGYDPAEEGIRVANEEARRRGLSIHAIVSDSENFDHGRDKWDLIVMTYVFDRNHLPLHPDGTQAWRNSTRRELLLRNHR